MKPSEEYCWARIGPDRCALDREPAHEQHETFWGSRDEIRVTWKDGDPGCWPDPRSHNSVE